MQNSNATNIVNLTEIEKAGVVEDMTQRWEESIGAATPQIRRIIASWCNRISDWNVCYAIDETSIAPQPSLRYFVAICRRLEGEKNK